MTLRLSTRARADLEDIRTYTEATWGEDQWLRYYRGLVQAFERIGDDPMTGQDRSLLAPNMRSLGYGKHLIFFAPIKSAGGIPVILRILHTRRHLPALSYYDDLNTP